jgi:hypothetical protein
MKTSKEISVASRNKTHNTQRSHDTQRSPHQDTADILEVEALLKRMTPPDNLFIIHGPKVEPGSCHGLSTERIQWMREDLRCRGESIVRVLERLRTANAKWANALIINAIQKHDEELSAIAQKLSNCSCTSGEPVDPI